MHLVEKPSVKLVVSPVISALRQSTAKPSEDTMTCERCGAPMYRMHAVWRCPSCRFKTDCCGW
jgi:rubrerythrin